MRHIIRTLCNLRALQHLQDFVFLAHNTTVFTQEKCSIHLWTISWYDKQCFKDNKWRYRLKLHCFRNTQKYLQHGRVAYFRLTSSIHPNPLVGVNVGFLHDHCWTHFYSWLKVKLCDTLLLAKDTNKAANHCVFYFQVTNHSALYSPDSQLQDKLFIYIFQCIPTAKRQI